MRVTGPGPTPNSLRATVSAAGDLHTVLVVRSGLLDIPEALRTGSSNRLRPLDHQPRRCRITLIAGLPQPQRLIAGVPTCSQLRLPFSVDAPFETDAEFAVVSPEHSALNAWLLNRAGHLAATTMCAWLGNRSQAVRDRAEALRLLTDRMANDGTLETACAEAVAAATATALRGRDSEVEFK